MQHLQSNDYIFDILQYDELSRFSMQLFRTAGHTFENEPVTCDRTIKDFVYIDLRHKQVLTPDDWLVLNAVDAAALLFTNGAEYFGMLETDYTIDYLAISLITSESDRSQLSYRIHQTIARLSPSPLSVVIFEANKNYMFSCAERRNDRTSTVILSDWYTVQKITDNEVLEKIDARYLSTKGAKDFFLDFEYAIARHYYRYPISYEYAAYEMFPLKLFDASDPIIGRETLDDIIRENLLIPLREYQDDFVYERDCEDSALIFSTDDFSLELMEFEANIEEDEENDDYFRNDDTDDDNEENFYKEKDTFFDELDDELFDDPVKMLEWIKKHSP